MGQNKYQKDRISKGGRLIAGRECDAGVNEL